MFGYFRFNQLYATPKIRNIYKNYYCGTCFAIEYNYGELARMILSYDIVIMALVGKTYDDANRKVLPCFFKKKEKIQFADHLDWQKVASMNVLLMNAKLDDDINDEQSKKAKLAALVFSSTVKKAKNKFPQMAETVRNGYIEMYELEKKNVDILVICNQFADMMDELITQSFDIDENKREFVRAISRWLYFIDQLDDYDDDKLEGKYNPLLQEGISKTDFINKENKYLFSVMKEIFKDFGKIKRELDLTKPENVLLHSVLNESIPSVTSMVLSGRKLPQILHTKKELEWKES